MLDSPEFVDPAIRDHLKGEYRRGLTPTNCLGLHGTSLETLMYVMKSGVLPGETRSSGRAFHLGDVFYSPLKSADRFADTVEDATWYARKNSKQHFLKNQLGLGLASPQDDHLIDLLLRINLHDKAYKKLLAQRGWQPGHISRLIEEAEQQQGILLGINIKAQSDYRTSKIGRFGIADGMIITTGGGGLPFPYIHGVEALGDREREFLDSL